MSNLVNLKSLADELDGISAYALNHFPDNVEERINELGAQGLEILRANNASAGEIERFEDNLIELKESVDNLRTFDTKVDDLARVISAAIHARESAGATREND